MKKFTLDIARSMPHPAYWVAFYEVSQVPRGTFNCKQIAQFLAQKLKKYTNQPIHIDERFNLYTTIKATKGCEHWPSICLQAHIDMVCAKTEDSKHDFKKDPIEILTDGKYLRANKTTLGADNGCGIATIFAVLESDQPHGPLDIALTADEEHASVGAIKMKPNVIHSKFLLNSDGEDFDHLYIGACGGVWFDTIYDVSREKLNGHKYLSISVKNLKGGHSAVAIQYKRINAIKWFFNVLYDLSQHKELDVCLVSVDGGLVQNTIPDKLSGVIAVNSKHLDLAKQLIQQAFDNYISEYENYDTPNFSLQEVNKPKFNPIIKKRSDEIINAYAIMYNGIEVINQPTGYQETSSNVGVITTTKDEIFTKTTVRSLYEHGCDRIFNQIQAIVNLTHGRIKLSERLLCWSPAPKNPIVPEFNRIYQKKVGKSVTILTCPGGLEVAPLLKNNPSIECAICCGATIQDVHLPTETLDIETAIKCYEIIQELVSTVDKWGNK